MATRQSKPARADGRQALDPRLREQLDYDDTRLLAECEVHTHRTGGPGGQHRNKAASAIRLRHRPSGLVVTATERRSQQENKAKALRRLREAMALYIRAPLPDAIVWPPTVQIGDGCLRLNEKNPAIYHVLALALDALAACGGRVQEAAGRLGVTPSSLARFLARHPKAWAQAGRIPRSAGDSRR